jgi:hypothetical protein
MAYRQHAPNLVSLHALIVGLRRADSCDSFRSICYVLDRSISSQMGKPSLVQQHLGPSEQGDSIVEPRVTASVVRSSSSSFLPSLYGLNVSE